MTKLSELTFKTIDRLKFPSIDFAYFAIEKGMGMPIFLNAANEVAVNHFLKDNIGFLDIYRLLYSRLAQDRCFVAAVTGCSMIPSGCAPGRSAARGRRRGLLRRR